MSPKKDEAEEKGEPREPQESRNHQGVSNQPLPWEYGAHFLVRRISLQAHLFLTACSSRFVVFGLMCPWTNRGFSDGSLLPLVGRRVLFGRGGRRLAETIKAIMITPPKFNIAPSRV